VESLKGASLGLAPAIFVYIQSRGLPLALRNILIAIYLKISASLLVEVVIDRAGFRQEMSIQFSA
jgi:hypothetical protein